MAHNPPSNRSTWARLSDWAADGRCIRVRCKLCRKSLHFFASDLVEVYHPSTLAHTWRPACSACGRVDYVAVRSFFPGPDDVGKLMFRRPGIVGYNFGKTSFTIRGT